MNQKGRAGFLRNKEKERGERLCRLCLVKKIDKNCPVKSPKFLIFFIIVYFYYTQDRDSQLTAFFYTHTYTFAVHSAPTSPSE